MNEVPPSVLKGRRLLVGVTGGIAAYKVPLLVREAVRRGAEVRVVLTENAARFVTPLTLEALSGSPVLRRMFDTPPGLAMAHIAWPREADLMVIAPATADFIAKMAAGMADDLLSTMVLALDVPLLIAPSMNSRMYGHPAVTRNLALLRERGVHVLEPATGELACGEEGIGRMAEVEEILSRLEGLLPSGPLAGKRILVTAGPTVEPIDPVRSLCNRSSGKQGYALAREAARRGGDVTLISGPTALTPPAGVTVIPVQTAVEMAEAVEQRFSEVDVLIMAAAVGDFRAEEVRTGKIKRGSGPWTLTLVPNPDILRGLARRRRETQVLVGFAAETGDLETEPRRKLADKGLDLIAVNDVSRSDLGFGAERNRVLLLDRQGGREDTGILPKEEIARRIWDRVCRDFL